MGRVPRIVLAALFVAGFGSPDVAGALGLVTTIDLDYTYSQENVDEDVTASTRYNQKYDIKYETALTSALDFVGAAKLDLQDAWYTNEGGTSRVAPTLELGLSGQYSTAKITYDAVRSTTELYHETAEDTTYSTNVSAELQLVPQIWPETLLKFQRGHEYQQWTSDSTTESLQLTVKKDFSTSLRLEFDFKQDSTIAVLPGSKDSSGVEWTGKATFKRPLWGGTDFEMAYQINESYSEDFVRDVFSGVDENYAQQLKTRLKNSLSLTPRLKLGLSWEYQFDQDLLHLDYDQKVANKFKLDLRWDLVQWIKLTGEAVRETVNERAASRNQEDTASLTDTVKAGFDLAPYSWLRLAGKAQLKSKGKINEDSAGSVDQTDDEKYEFNIKNRFGEFWDLAVDASTSSIRKDGWLTDRSTKFKAALTLRLLDLSVKPAYETTRSNSWARGFDDPDAQKQTRVGTINVEYKLRLLDLFAATFSHEYGIKAEDDLDEFLNFERTLQLSEDTRLNITITEIVRDLKLECEVQRNASDTEDDPDPQLVEISYALKLDWKLDALALNSSLLYNDKGDTYDDLSFNTKVTWTGEQLTLSGEYQFDTIYADATSESRKLNLKLNYKF